MGPSVLNRIFEPFYTTRKPSEGTGLGLSVAHGIIKGYGGVITVESAPAKGSIFKVYLPTVDEETLTTSLPAAASLQTGNERILLVDDDTDMLYSIKKLLERLGYTVVSCLESSQALETFLQDPEGYSLIIADQIMPSMTGLQLSKEISKCRPDIPIILCSGVLDESSVEVSTELLQNNGIAAFIHKPFSMVEISQVIRRVFRCGAIPNPLKEPVYGQSSDHR
jgi:CheY-like chemotaxis protein